MSERTEETKPLHEDTDAQEQCDLCHGSGLRYIGNSGSESDGNAPEFERCTECTSSPPLAEGGATLKFDPTKALVTAKGDTPENVDAAIDSARAKGGLK